MGLSSCLATLFLASSVEVSVCDTSLVSLPTATNFGFGIWLIKSASNGLIFRESHATSLLSKTQSFASCSNCIVILECGMQILTPSIKIRSNLSRSSQIPAIKMRVSLPNPFTSPIMQVRHWINYQSMTRKQVQE